ncbi:bifunctional tetrahydrofolate synthase/dihydrofolate synthase [Pseudomonas sp. EpS/L25]|uniref:bifunctional tetrahydrofolate synthase/dihydrofolate synthase n=1 Tax=Pseudomonas sp. EpS/L25 TaxID=1749078 RepID=UPI00074334D8|nr:bifunctional tetrahydrofolate synthase/dihydrofolate synthase [Pseudomonas sp. EpS/L25]KUM33968.1 bifunctional folylpolyglutamate synthase/dihydrofolate synthase [Pseudomonas sp. EpS/L25]
MSSRSLAQWLAYLEQLHPSAIDMGLDRVREVAQRLGLTRPAPRVVTVTGTNGKGSTCAFLASLLRANGQRVGVYASPHLVRYNERVDVEGILASDDDLCTAFAAVDAARGEISLTYFEMGTLAAFWLFERAQLDVAVLEVGLGGRLDAVNLIDADLALVTSIGLDHAEWLGDTRESVAVEKAGIFRAGKPALCGDLEPPAPLTEAAERLGAPLLQRGEAFDLRIESAGWFWRGRDAQGNDLTLAGLPLLDLPMENAALALQAYALLGLPWIPERIAAALLATRMAGRLDRRQVAWAGERRQVLLDVAHNPHAAEYLARRLTMKPVAGVRRAVFGVLADKDLDGILAPLERLFASWAVATLPTGRSRDGTEVAAILTARGAQAEVHDSLVAAFDAQLAASTADDEVVVFGSFYSVAEVLAQLTPLSESAET